MAEPGYKELASEVVALGEHLFALALQEQADPITANNPTSDDGEQSSQAAEPDGPSSSVEEMRIAADEFFAALRLLLGLPENEAQ